MLDTYQELWNRVLLRCPSLSPKLAQDLIVNAFRRLAERRRWSWLVKFGQFIVPAVYNTGTVTVTTNLTTVTGSGTTWTAAMVGRQFRIGLSAPIYTIAQFTSATSIELDQPFGGDTQSAVGYSIYQCYFTPPTDFHQFICLWDPAYNWQLYLDVQQSELNIWDAQRSNVGNAYVVSFYDYTSSQVGVVNAALTVNGTGNVPVSGGTFQGPVSSIFTIEMTTSGAPGTAVYKWKKNDGSYTSGVVTDAGGNAQALMDGVQILFPLGFSYTTGNIFVIACDAISNSGLPRYELWPGMQSTHVYPFLYEARPQDLDDPGIVIPRYIRGDVLVEMALAELALWPGLGSDKLNPYASQQRYLSHEAKSEMMVNLLEIQDDNVWQQDLQYQYQAISWALATPLGDARFLQSHSV